MPIKFRRIAPLTIAIFALQLILLPGFVTIVAASELTGQYSCNSGEKVAELDDPTHPVTPYFEIYSNSETLTVRSGGACEGIVIIPDGVQEIEENAFKNSVLTEIVLPNTIRVIGNQAFQNSHLTRINLPEGINIISNSSFKNSMLEEVKIPNSIETIENDAFYNISELVSVTFGSNIKSIGAYAFALTGITNLALPPSLETVNTNAFSSTSLVSIYIPQSVQTIGWEAFAYNSHLSTLSISDSVTSLANNAFTSSNMAAVDTSYCGTNYIDIDGKFFGSPATCRPPSNLNLTVSTSNADRRMTIKLGNNFNHGGSAITSLKLENFEGDVLQSFDYNPDSIFILTDQPVGKNLKFRVRVENSAGLYGYSSFTNGIIFNSVASESEEARRQFEIRRQLEIAKARANTVSKLESGESPSLEDFKKSDFDGVTPENFTRVQNQIAKIVDLANPQIQDIEKAIRYVGTVDALCLQAIPPMNLRAGNLVDVGLLSADNKNKTQIYYLIKQSPLDLRQDEESLLSLIASIEARLRDRKDRLAQIRARSEARKALL